MRVLYLFLVTVVCVDFACRVSICVMYGLVWFNGFYVF